MSDHIAEPTAVYETFEQRLAAEDALIKRWIMPDPNGRGRAEVRVVERGVSVWVLVHRWLWADGDIAEIASDYELPHEAMRAALAYYRRHKQLIDARLLLEFDEDDE